MECPPSTHFVVPAKAGTHLPAFELEAMLGLKRPFRAPAGWLVGLDAIGGCAYLFISLPVKTILACFIWNAIGLGVYFLHGRRRAALAALNAG